MFFIATFSRHSQPGHFQTCGKLGHDIPSCKEAIRKARIDELHSCIIKAKSAIEDNSTSEPRRREVAPSSTTRKNWDDVNEHTSAPSVCKLWSGCQMLAGRHDQEMTVASPFRSSRDVIIRTEVWVEATTFYGSVLGLPVLHESESLMGFETGASCLYVEKGERLGPVFEFLVPDIQAAKSRLLSAGCTIQEENDSIPRCYIRDPYGVVFNIGQVQGES
jgi:predicted enzyme related to lactoylglutathione lyase